MSEKRSWPTEAVEAADRLVDRLVEFASGTKAPLVVGAALFAYLNQPLVRFIDVYPAYEGALVFTLAIILLAAGMTIRRDWLCIIFGFFALYIGSMWIADALQDATQRAAANDTRCLRVEAEMLSDKPPRNDLPDIFQALGCRPRTSLYQPVTAARS